MVLVYRVPREPSSPRIAIWRRIKSLGVGQLADGVVVLPYDARTLEALEWVAQSAVEAGGTALLLTAETFTAGEERSVIEPMTQARAAEYQALITRIDKLSLPLADAESVRTAKRLRAEFRSIQRRDYFPPPERDLAAAAVRRVAQTAAAATIEAAL